MDQVFLLRRQHPGIGREIAPAFASNPSVFICDCEDKGTGSVIAAAAAIQHLNLIALELAAAA